MTQVTYSSQFSGRFEPANDNGTVLKTKMQAEAFEIEIENGGGRERLGGASIRSTVIYTGEASFQQYGTITFANNNDRLHFSTKGQGRISEDPVTKIRLGSATLRIDYGRGRFEKASGVITSNFVINDNGEVTDNQVGVVEVG